MREKTFYTYLWLREDGTPYYVGKGKGKRAYRKDCPPHDRILIQPHPSEQDAFAVEAFLIAYYGRIDQGTGILRNLTDGGDGVSNPSEETRRKIAGAQTGRKASPEVRKKLSEVHKGKTQSEETRRRMSAALTGHVVSEETRRKIADAHRGKKLSESTLEKMRNRQVSDQARRWMSLSAQGRTAWNKGLPASAESRRILREANRKLSDADVNLIRTLFGKMLSRDIATHFGVSKATISGIKNGKGMYQQETRWQQAA